MKYTENHRLGDIISDHYQLLLVMSRFGIPLGFGDKSVRCVCSDNAVECNTFLAVINYVANGDTTSVGDVSPRAMVGFLKLAHSYYLDYLFPKVRRKLVKAIDFEPTREDKLTELVMGFFDGYVEGIAEHLKYEEDVVFKYVERLCEGTLDGSEEFRMEHYARHHEQINSKLKELKRILIKYYPNNGRAGELNSALYSIYNCEQDLISHCDIEDNVFVPAVVALETQIGKA